MTADVVAREAKYNASQKAANNLLRKLGARLEMLDRWVSDPPSGDLFIVEVRFMVRYSTVGDVLAVIKGVSGGEKVIAFHSDDTVTEALTGMVNRLNNGTLKWKEDKPYDKG